MSKTVIRIEKLVKKYRKLTAVNEISFSVKKGEVFGLLGENGAGKTTTLEIIEGLRKPTSGKILVLDHDIKRGLRNIKEKIGVQLQSSAYYSFLTLTEILHLFGSFYSKYQDPQKLLEMVDLKDKASSYVNSLSGGQKQRFSIVASLINDPEIVFLDEPTTGLDPVARRNLWEIISKIKSQGKTIILTTHYMEEAEMLCDRVAIMEHGKILTIGETHKLIEQVKFPFKIDFVIQSISLKRKKELSKYGEVINMHRGNHHQLLIKHKKDLNSALAKVQKMKPESFSVVQASLEDLFIELTGKTITEEEEVNA